nr:RDD family protein [Candidatus Baldrarchaeota archaeon]
ASILWAYWTITEGYKGQSLGKILMGIRVVKSDGRRLPLQDSAVRSIGKAFLLPLDVIVGLMFFRRKKVLRFTDYYTDTIVVEV